MAIRAVVFDIGGVLELDVIELVDFVLHSSQSSLSNLHAYECILRACT